MLVWEGLIAKSQYETTRERNVVEYPSILEIDPQDPSTFGFLEIGTITGPHGVKGEMKLTVSTDFAEQRLSMPGTRYVKVGLV